MLFSLLMSFLLDYWVEPWGAMAESTSHHPGLDLITIFQSEFRSGENFPSSWDPRFELAFPPPCFPQITPPGLVLGVHTIAWTSINSLGALCLGQKYTTLIADHTVVITNGSTNSQKLPICKLDKEQILARIEMKTEIWVPFLLQSQPHNETERGGSVGVLPLRLHLSWAILLYARA